MVLGKRKKKEDTPSAPNDPKTKQNSEKKQNHSSHISNGSSADLSRFKKKTFSVSLYPEEYDILMEMIQKYGYKRSEFILASAQTATQGTMAKAQKKVVMVRKEIRKEEKELKAKHRRRGPLREFCVSDFRQNQEYHVFNVQDEGLFPLVTSLSEGWDGMRAACSVNAGPACRESCFKGISPPSGRRT